MGVIHDAKYIDHVYEVLKPPRGASRIPEYMIQEAKHKWALILLSLHHKTKEIERGNTSASTEFTEDERRVFNMFADIADSDKFLAAAHRKRIRFQLGQKNRFLEGLKISGRYLPYMEKTFKAEGLPVELTRLPFVESSFNVRARSKVGASGVWQFMRSTGKLYVEIDDAVDERNDPMRATEAAAKLLRMNYSSLKNWGLAVTAYNHGRLGIMRAVRQVGSEQIEDLVDTYHSNSFGFASSNFFSCLLAAIEVEKNAEQYFGPIQREAPIRFYEVKLPDFINLPKMAKFMHLSVDLFRPLNPGLSDEVFQGRLYVPKGYKLRLPKTEKEGTLPEGAEQRIFLAGYSEIPGIYKAQHQKGSR